MRHLNDSERQRFIMLEALSACPHSLTLDALDARMSEVSKQFFGSAHFAATPHDGVLLAVSYYGLEENLGVMLHDGNMVISQQGRTRHAQLKQRL